MRVYSSYTGRITQHTKTVSELISVSDKKLLRENYYAKQKKSFEQKHADTKCYFYIVCFHVSLLKVANNFDHLSSKLKCKL